MTVVVNILIMLDEIPIGAIQNILIHDYHENNRIEFEIHRVRFDKLSLHEVFHSNLINQRNQKNHYQ